MSGYVSVWCIGRKNIDDRSVYLRRIDHDGLVWCPHTSEAILFRSEKSAKEQIESLRINRAKPEVLEAIYLSITQS